MYIMSKARSMYAGSSGSNYGVNKNSPGNGNGKWQGLWPSVGHARNARLINTRAGGDNRNVVFCMNQLGGVGRISNMFATTADGVKDCVNGKLNWRGGYLPKTHSELLNLVDKNSDKKISTSELNQAGLKHLVEADSNKDNLVSFEELSNHLNMLSQNYNILPRPTEFTAEWNTSAEFSQPILLIGVRWGSGLDRQAEKTITIKLGKDPWVKEEEAQQVVVSMADPNEAEIKVDKGNLVISKLVGSGGSIVIDKDALTSYAIQLLNKQPDLKININSVDVKVVRTGLN